MITRHTPIDPSNARGAEEAEALKLGGVVLNLAGLWGAQRLPWNWIPRVAGDKTKLKEKGSLHLIHGEDVAKGIVGVVERLLKGEGKGERWIVTDLRCYDWWDLCAAWGNEEVKGWVREGMREGEVEVLPRKGRVLGRRVGGREFWEWVGGWPGRTLVVGRD